MVLRTLEAAPQGISMPGLMQRLNLSWGRIDKTLKLLSLESPSPIVKEGARWQLTAAHLDDGFWERARRLTELRRVEQRQMQEYVGLESGHMAFLIRALDGDPTGIGEPAVARLPGEVSAELVREAIAFLKRSHIPIEPRRRWPGGGMPRLGESGSIPAEYQAQPGRALCYWGDAGWGELVRDGKYHDGHYADELVDACVELVARWNPQAEPEWVTFVPSLRHTDLVPDFAARLATRLALPFQQALRKTEERPEQKTMENSTQQARNIDGAMAVVPGRVLKGPVLLIDDIIDSGWTMTVAAFTLLANGSGEVHPLALAMAGKRQ